MALGGPQGCSNQRNDNYLGLNAQKAAGGVGAWKPSHLQAQLGSTCCREEHVENGSSSVLSCLAAATQSWTYRLSWRMSSCGGMRQQWLKSCCCHRRIGIVAWGMTHRGKTELIEREEPEWNQIETMAAEVLWMSIGHTSSAYRAGTEHAHCLGTNLRRGTVEVWRQLEAQPRTTCHKARTMGPLVLLKTACSSGLLGDYADNRDHGQGYWAIAISAISAPRLAHSVCKARACQWVSTMLAQ